MKNWLKMTVLGMMTVLAMTLTSNAWALTVVDEGKSPVPVTNGIIAILIGLFRTILGG